MAGRALREILIARGHTPICLKRAELNIADASSLKAALDKHQPRLVLNCAAHTKVDLCETDLEQAEAINGTAVGKIAEWCAAHDAMIVHISTDFIFDGTKRTPYAVDDQPNPRSAYGRTKLLGETLLQKASPKHWLLVRTAWVYGRGGANFPRTMVQVARMGKPLRVVADQLGRPTYAVDLAEAIVDLVESDANGIYHVSNSGETNWHEFAVATLAAFGIDAPVEPVTSEAWKLIRPVAAERPQYSVLDLSGTTRQLGREMRPWRAALEDYARAAGQLGFD
jgi:dTDP-4-dehydrorhamnose reductase